MTFGVTQDMQPTNITFGDASVGGCSSALENFIAEDGGNLTLCASPSFNCSCSNPAKFSDGQYITDMGIGIAIEFASFETDPGQYTLYLADIGLTVSTPAFQSTQSGIPNAAAGIFQTQVLQTQVALDAAITGKSIAVTVERFPQLTYDIWDPGALMNYPMYMTMLMFYGILTITVL